MNEKNYAIKQTVQYKKDYVPSMWHIEQAKIKFDVYDEYVIVTSRLYMKRVEKDKNWLFLDGENLELLSINLSGKELEKQRYETTERGLRIKKIFAKNFIIKLIHKVYPKKNAELGLFYTKGVLCSQCEAQGFRKITYFIDRPDIMTEFRCKIIADREKYPVMLSNGKRLSYGKDKKRHWVIWHDPIKKPCYLFALVLGNLAKKESTYFTKSNKKITLQAYADALHINKCEYALECLKKAMQWEEEKYELTYDAETYMMVAIENFPSRAMENKGLNIFNVDAILASPDTTTDEQYKEILGIIAHEYFHNWIGNRITIKNWFALVLKEGLVTFKQQQFLADMTNEVLQRIETVIELKETQLSEEESPLAHALVPDSYMDIDNFYDRTIYNKGAEVFRLLEHLLGKEKFLKSIKFFLKKYNGQAVGIEEFFEAIEKNTAKDLQQFLLWFTQVETPTIKIICNYDEPNKGYQINTIQQYNNQVDNPPLYIPLEILLIDRMEGEFFLLDIDKGQNYKILKIRRQYEKFLFTDIESTPLLAIRYSPVAALNINFEYNDNDLIFSIAHDTDLFNRWYITKKIFYRYFQEQIQRYREDKVLYIQDDYLITFQKILTSSSLESSYIAKNLELPSEKSIHHELNDFDVDSVHYVREYIIAALAKRLMHNFLTVYKKNSGDEFFSLEKEVVASRLLKNIIMKYMGSSEELSDKKMIFQHYQKASNMSDKMAALHCIKNYDERDSILSKLHKEWKNQPLLFCQWLSLYASSKLPDTLQKIKKIANSSDFDRTASNCIYSLVGTFCFHNHIQFHQLSGEGYRFLTDWVIELDDTNPHLSSRLAKAFNNWHRFHPKRQKLIKENLSCILEKRNCL